MGLSLRARADTVATFRFVSVAAMETLARWVPTTPELEVKILFGRHIWDFAQHADALGRRTADLRLPAHHSLRPRDAYVALLETVAQAGTPMQRIVGLYDVLLPDLSARCRRYLDATDQLLDEPTVRILERMIADYARLMAERATIGTERPDLVATDPDWAARLRAATAGVGEWVAFRPAATANAETA